MRFKLIMNNVKTTPYDVAEHIRTPEDAAAYLEACLEEADADSSFIAKALGDIARAKGMSQVAKDTGLSRESLYKALSGERNPGFDTVLKVMKALGLKLHASVNLSDKIIVQRIRLDCVRNEPQSEPFVGRTRYSKVNFK